MTNNDGSTRWTFITNHGHVLLAIARDPRSTLREIADAVRITERAAFRIIDELATEGYITKRKVGRCNVYEIHANRPLRHPLEEHEHVGALIRLVTPSRADLPQPAAAGASALS